MKAFFKDNDKLIINSLDHNERLVGETFLDAYSKGATLKVEARNDINDDFDGLVLTLVELTPDTEPVTEPDTEPEPVTEPITDPETDPVTEPVTNPETEPTTEPEG